MSPVYALSPPFFLDFIFGIRKIDRPEAGLSPFVFCASAAINEKKTKAMTPSRFVCVEGINQFVRNCLKITA
jgi:hypothetical protein